jgi:drug/metabolite transporter (DMT)-like permease
MLLGLCAALGAALLFGAAAVLQAVAVRRHGLVSRLMAVVCVGYLLGWGLHLVAIALLPLYLAQMAIGGSLAVTALIASRVVHEPLERHDWVSIGAMVTGFAMLIAVAGPVGVDDRHPELTLVLYLSIAAIGAAGLVAWRMQRGRSGLFLGMLAGLSYAGAPIATRSLEHVHLDSHAVAPALAIALFGTLGFVMQSLALERVSVTAAIAPMVLLETFVPAALGIAIFGDQVRHGFGLVALLGFLVATGGALVLSGAEARLDHLEHVHVDELEHVHVPDVE